MRQIDNYLLESLRLADKLLELADQGDAARDDVGCGILFGVMRDCAYKLKNMTIREQEKHKLVEK